MGKFPEPYLLTGSKGMLGTELVRLLAEAGIETAALDLDEMDVRDADAVLEVFREYKPRLVINTAAMTDVDGCETRQDEAFAINAVGTKNVARACLEIGSFLVHLSTDYVFDGRKRAPYKEEDEMSPQGIYARSKAQGERHVRDLLPNSHCIVRTQWLFGLHGKNFVEAILNLAQEKDVIRVVNDQRGSPTHAPDLAMALIKLCRLGARGTIHVTNSGETTWHDFACRIIEESGIASVRVVPISSQELARPAPRPMYSVLDNSRFIELVGAALRHWEEALQDYLRLRKMRIRTLG